MFELLRNLLDGLAVSFDLPILDWIAANLWCPALDFLMPIITTFGDGGIFWIAISVILMITHNAKRNKKVKFELSLLVIAAGVANCCANYIVLFLSPTENASVLFPIIAIANIITVWVIGIIFFKERLRALQTIGLMIGVVSVVLLKL